LNIYLVAAYMGYNIYKILLNNIVIIVINNVYR
jgi:hypothetical protein